MRQKLLQHFVGLRASTLLMNAFYLMLSTFAVAVTGFVFWAVVTRTYDAADVGLATTLLSVSGLLSLLGLAGFDTTFVRFLPKAADKNQYINSGLMVVAIISASLSVIVGVILPFLTPSLGMLGSTGTLAAFVFFTVATALNTLTNAVFLAFKHARYILIINVCFCVVKVALPLAIVGGNAVTVFVIAGIAQLLGLVLSLWYMKRHLQYRFSPKLHIAALRVVRKYSLTVYSASILNLLPPTLLPLLVVHHMGPSNAAYYYMAFTIASVLYTVAYASMQSVFAEGSHDEASVHIHVAKAAKLIAAILLPAAIIVAAAGSLCLSVFGQEYSQHATGLLQLFALSSLPVAAYSAMGAIFKVTKQLRGVLVMNIVYAGTIMALGYILLPRLGLLAIGWAWLLGNTAAICAGLAWLADRQSVSKLFVSCKSLAAASWSKVF